MGEFKSLFGSSKERFQPLFGGASPAADTGSGDGFTPFGLSVDTQPEAAPLDVDELVRQARQQGADAARADLNEEMQDLRAQLAAVNNALDEVARMRQEQVRAAAKDVGDLVLALARRVVGDSLALHPDALPAVVEQALGLLPDEDDLSIRVAPEDVERVRGFLSPRRRDQVYADANVAQGCLVEGRQVAIDSTLKSALEGAAVAVQSWVESHG